MSILIPGMEMPDKCGHCRFANAFDCTVTGSFISTHSIRQPDCPLVPVPPHGRLVDADEFLKRAIGTKCFRGDYALMLEELVGESTTIIPADQAEEGEG